MEHEAPRILVVDDNEIHSKILAQRLINEGYEVEYAASGESALKAVTLQQIDLIMLDMMMPGMDGYQVLTILQAHKQYSQIPVVIITAKNDVDMAVKCIDMGAEDYINKPVVPALLLARARSCLEKKFLRDREKKLMAQLEREKKNLERFVERELDRRKNQ
jgi:adenylate cyclase